MFYYLVIVLIIFLYFYQYPMKINVKLSFGEMHLKEKIPILILHPNLTYYSMLSIWQARQLNDDIHVLYDHKGTIERSCSTYLSNKANCSSMISMKLSQLIESLHSSQIYFTDLNSKDLQNEVNDFRKAFQRGNNRTLFDLYHRDKWIYEEWCAIRWLYAYNYALKRKFHVIYIEDSDVLLYGNMTMEFDYLKPIDVGMIASSFRAGSSGHSAIFRLKALRMLIDFMLETWAHRTDVAGYVRSNWVTDMFYFTHLFEHRNNQMMRRGKGLIIRLLHDVYYADKYNSSSGRIFDWHAADHFNQRFSLTKVQHPNIEPGPLKNFTWITDKGEYFNSSSISISHRFPIIYHYELQENIRLISLHFHGNKKRFIRFYIQRYIFNNNIDQLLQFNFFSDRTLL